MLISLEKSKGVQPEVHYNDKFDFKGKKKEIRTRGFVGTTSFCFICKENHFIQNCSQFLKLTVKMRYEKDWVYA